MQPKLIKTEIAQYQPQEWDGESNTSGWAAFGDSVLILVDIAAETQGKMGLILTTQENQDKQSLGTETGLVVDIGEGAFTKVVGRRPERGDRVLFERYAGRVIAGEDGKTYRMLSQECIAGIQTRDKAAA